MLLESTRSEAQTDGLGKAAWCAGSDVFAKVRLKIYFFTFARSIWDILGSWDV